MATISGVGLLDAFGGLAAEDLGAMGPGRGGSERRVEVQGRRARVEKGRDSRRQLLELSVCGERGLYA